MNNHHICIGFKYILCVVTVTPKTSSILRHFVFCHHHPVTAERSIQSVQELNAFMLYKHQIYEIFHLNTTSEACRSHIGSQTSLDIQLSLWQHAETQSVSEAESLHVNKQHSQLKYSRVQHIEALPVHTPHQLKHSAF